MNTNPWFNSDQLAGHSEPRSSSTPPRLTDGGTIPPYSIRKCRGHWHVCISGGEDDLITRPVNLTYEQALDICQRLNADPNADLAASSPPPPSTELPGEIEGAIRVLQHAVAGSNCLPGNREAEAFALTNLRSIIAKHLAPATPSSPVPAPEHEWLDDGELAAIEEETRAFIHDGAIPPDATDLCFAVLELRGMLSRLRSQLERMRVEAESQSLRADVARVIPHTDRAELDRLRADLLTPEEARAIERYIPNDSQTWAFHPEFGKAVRSAIVKLRRRLSSDSEIGDTK